MGTKLVYLHGRILLGNKKVVTQLLSQTGMNWTDFMLNDGRQVEKQKQTKPLTFHLYDILGHVKLAEGSRNQTQWQLFMESVSVTMEIDYKGAGEAGSTGDHPLGRDRLWQQVRPDEIYIDHLRTVHSLRLRKRPGAEHGSRFESATGRTGEETLEKMTGQEWVGWRAGWTCIGHAHWKSKQ